MCSILSEGLVGRSRVASPIQISDRFCFMLGQDPTNLELDNRTGSDSNLR
ncbi:MAG TPA: hypothetical protein V6D04_13720 [Candidatus Obscuribacterales bacterium]